VYVLGLMSNRALIVVPTYNERDNVEEVTEKFLAPLDEAEILFVDDNSPDGTGALLDDIESSNPRVHVMHREGKMGLGTAYLAGFRWALEHDYDFILEMDADFSHHPRYLPEMTRMAAEGAAMVVGSRYVMGGGTLNWGVGRQIVSRAGSFYARAILGVGVRDLTSGFICYRRETLAALDLDKVKSSGYSFQIEMKYRVIQAGLEIAELPIVFEDRRVGQSKMSSAIFLEAIGMVWKLRFGPDR
jgi:dolichol-phosphate mannosyltransferase